MRHLKRTCLLLLLIIIGSLPTRAQDFLHVSGKQIVDGKGQNVLLRGVGLGGWMLQEGYMLQVNGKGMQHTIRARIADLIGEDSTNAFYDAWLANHTRRIDIDSMKAWGFNSVRLPMHFNLYTLPVDKEPEPGKQTWLEKGFRITDSLLAWCKANQMYLILDLHAAPGGQGNDLNISDRDPSKPSLWDSEANRQKTIALWRKLAERYANEPYIGGYDILNEPNWGFEDLKNDKNGLNEKGNQPLKQLMVDITKAIREADKNHLIIIEGNGWGNNYNGVLPTWDNNMVLSFHKYWSYNTTASIKNMLEIRDKYNVPVWLGETGENSNVWFAEAVQLLEANNIGWAWWPLKKLGNNNPMQVLGNKYYSMVLDYWLNRGPRPTQTEAYNGLMQLADALKLEHTAINRDVLDALFRQPYSQTAIPFKENMIKSGAKVKAVDYDLGRNGIAYFDKDTADYHISNGPRGGNQGRMYRNDGVDITGYPGRDGFYVNHAEAGEWLQYTLNVLKAGHYQIQLNCNPGKEDGKLSFLVNKNGARKVAVPKANGWQYLQIKDIELKKGTNNLRIYIDAGDMSLGDMQFTEVK